MSDTIKRLWRGRGLLLGMVLLQVLSLTVRWLLMPNPNWTRLAFLLLFTLGAGVAITWLPRSFLSRLRHAREALVQREHVTILVLVIFMITTSIIFANARGVASDEDSMYRAAVVLADSGVGPFFSHYAELYWLGDQHPPLAPVVYGFAMHFLGPYIIVMRLVCIALNTGIVVVTYLLGRDLYDGNTGLVAAWLLISMPLFLRLGALASNDSMVFFFLALGLWLSLRLARTPSYWLAVLIGLVISAGMLSKYTMVFIYPILGAAYLLNPSFRRIKLHLAVAVLVSAALPAAWLVYAAQTDILAKQATRIGGYVGLTASPTSKWGLAGTARMRYRLREMSTDLTNGLGAFNLLTMALGIWLMFRRRKRSDLLILGWIVIVGVPVTIVLPDSRYFFVAAPALALAMAAVVRRMHEIQDQVILLSLVYCGQVLYLYTVVRQSVRTPFG